MFRVVNLILCALLNCNGALGLQFRVPDVLNLKDGDGVLRPENRGPTLVNVSLVMHSLVIDDKNQVLELSGELHQEWDDAKLRFTVNAGDLLGTSLGISAVTGREIMGLLWRPDLTCSHEIKPESSNPRLEFIRITNAGHLSWTQKVRFTFPCTMDLSSYPIGAQSCTLKLQSIGYDARELEPSWSGDTGAVYNQMTISHGYELEKLVTSGKTVVTNLQMMKRELRVKFEFRKTSGWSLKHIMIPMASAVTTAYLSFFINIRGIGARITTCMLSMVAAAIFHESGYRMVPPASYTMALEVFTGTCLTFIFIATVECVIVDVLAHLPTKGRRSTPSPHTSFALEPDLTEDRSGTRGQVAALWLDRCFRVLYPAAFLAFNAVYWILYN